MTEKKRAEARGDVQTEEAHRNAVQTEERIQEESQKDRQKGFGQTNQMQHNSSTDVKRSQVPGGEESKHGRKQKGNSERP